MLNFLLKNSIVSMCAIMLAIFPARSIDEGLSMPELKIASTFSHSSLTLDPAKAVMNSELQLLLNLYGRLVTYNRSGDLVPDLADSFSWHGADLVFHFNHFNGGKARSIDGYPVTAEDAAASLERNLHFDQGKPSDLRLFLCGRSIAASGSGKCSGIRVEGDDLILTPTNNAYAGHILPLLTQEKFSILLRRSLGRSAVNNASLSANSQNGQLEIVDSRNTTGPYFVSRDQVGGSWELRANPNHYLYRAEMPQRVRLVTGVETNVLEALRKRQIDVVPTSVPDLSDQADWPAGLVGVTEYASVPIVVEFLCFTPRAVAKFSREQRLYVAQKFVERMTAFRQRGGTPTVEFFQAMSEGSLSETNRRSLEELRRQKRQPKFTEPMIYKARATVFDAVSKILKDVPEIKLVLKKKPSLSFPIDQRGDFYFMSDDSSRTESLALLSASFTSGMFHLPGVNGAEWLRAYTEIDDKKARLEKLTELHRQLLEQVIIYPIAVSPYRLLVRDPWTTNFGTLQPDTEIWKMQLRL